MNKQILPQRHSKTGHVSSINSCCYLNVAFLTVSTWARSIWWQKSKFRSQCSLKPTEFKNIKVQQTSSSGSASSTCFLICSFGLLMFSGNDWAGKHILINKDLWTSTLLLSNNVSASQHMLKCVSLLFMFFIFKYFKMFLPFNCSFLHF